MVNLIAGPGDQKLVHNEPLHMETFINRDLEKDFSAAGHFRS
jgi:hypothetical protein